MKRPVRGRDARYDLKKSGQATRTLRLIVQIGPRQCQQPALPTNAQPIILAHHFLPRVPSN